MSGPKAALLALFCLGPTAGGCVTSTHEVKPDYVPREVVELQRFDVRHGGASLGRVLQLQIDDASGPIRFWRIENRNGAWVGFASAEGRFSRRVPFRDDDLDLGIWPMDQGVARLFDVDGTVELLPLPVAEFGAEPASARRR